MGFDNPIFTPAHPTNILTSRPNVPKVSVLHTPEEDADDIEVTPTYFQLPNRDASTHAYADSDGDYYVLVPETQGAIANGVTRLTRPYPADTDPSYSLNYQSRSIEIEGRAHSIHLTCQRGSAQWQTVVRWVLDGYIDWGIPLDRAHTIGHYEVASDRTDPGLLDIDAIVEDAVALLNQENDMTKEEVEAIAKALYEDRVSSLEVVNYGVDFDPSDAAAVDRVIAAGGTVKHVLDIPQHTHGGVEDDN